MSEYQSDKKKKPTNVKNSKETNSEKQGSWKRELIETVLYVAVFVGLFLLVQHFLFVIVGVEGDSMEPTLSDGDKLVLNKVSDIERFDIVVFPAPDNPDNQYIKRVIGLPGDKIRYENDQLYINDQAIEEPYLDPIYQNLDDFALITGHFTLESLYGVQEVPPSSYFVLGDNRLNSRDSRSFGFVSEDSIVGETQLQLWPLSELGMVE